MIIRKWLDLATRALAACGTPVAFAKTFITIGSGSTTALYYPTAVSMAETVVDANGDVRADARLTGGSVYNDRAVGVDQSQMGFSQNDVEDHVGNGQDVEAFEHGPVKNLLTAYGLSLDDLKMSFRRLIASATGVQGLPMSWVERIAMRVGALLTIELGGWADIVELTQRTAVALWHRWRVGGAAAAT